jgi:hypothetical protein
LGKGWLFNRPFIFSKGKDKSAFDGGWIKTEIQLKTAAIVKVYQPEKFSGIFHPFIYQLSI